MRPERMGPERRRELAAETVSGTRLGEPSIESPVATRLNAGGRTEFYREFYRLMYLSRRTDDREIMLKRQQKDLLPDLVRGT